MLFPGDLLVFERVNPGACFLAGKKNFMFQSDKQKFVLHVDSVQAAN